MTFDQFFRIIKARWVLTLSVLLAIILVTMAITMVIPKSYKATASVMIDMKPDPITGISGAMGAQVSNLIATQIDLIKSPAVSARVIKQLRIDESEDMKNQWVKATGGNGDFKSWVAKTLSQNLEARPSRESNIIDIEYTSVNSKFAEILANAYAKAYMELSVQIRIDPARQYHSFFEERSQIARDRLETAQTKLAEAQREKGIIATDERFDAENSRLNELSSQLASLRAIGSDSSNRSSVAKFDPNQSPDIVNHPMISSLRAEISRQEAKVEEISVSFGDKHPALIEAKAMTASLQSRLQTEISRISKSLQLNSGISLSRESDIQKAYDEQRNKILKMKEARTELAVLEREVESAQRIYEAIQLRLSQMGLESNNLQNNIVLVSQAAEPSTHHSPRKLIALLLSISVGSLVAILTALGVELMDRRIRGPQDLLQGTGLPMIGTMPGQDSKKIVNKLLKNFQKTKQLGLNTQPKTAL